MPLPALLRRNRSNPVPADFLNPLGADGQPMPRAPRIAYVGGDATRTITGAQVDAAQAYDSVDATAKRLFRENSAPNANPGPGLLATPTAPAPVYGSTGGEVPQFSGDAALQAGSPAAAWRAAHPFSPSGAMPAHLAAMEGPFMANHEFRTAQRAQTLERGQLEMAQTRGQIAAQPGQMAQTAATTDATLFRTATDRTNADAFRKASSPSVGLAQQIRGGGAEMPDPSEEYRRLGGTDPAQANALFREKPFFPTKINVEGTSMIMNSLRSAIPDTQQTRPATRESELALLLRERAAAKAAGQADVLEHYDRAIAGYKVKSDEPTLDKLVALQTLAADPKARQLWQDRKSAAPGTAPKAAGGAAAAPAPTKGQRVRQAGVTYEFNGTSYVAIGGGD